MIGPRGPINLGCPVNMLAPLNRGLVAWWINLPATRGGSRLIDAVRQNHGTLTNMSSDVWSSLNRRGGYGSLGFDGSNDIVTVEENTNFGGGQTYMSWSAWLYPTSSDTGGRTFIMLGDYAPAGKDEWGYAFQWTHTFGNVRTFIAGSGSDAGVNYYDTSSGGISTSAWHHVTISFDGSLAAGSRITIYLNGDAMTGSASGTIPTTIKNPTGTNRLNFGSFVGLGRYFMGNMDDIRIYDRSLAADEVKMLYHASVCGYMNELNRLRRFTLNEVAAGVTAKPFFYNRYVVARSR